MKTFIRLVLFLTFFLSSFYAEDNETHNIYNQKKSIFIATKIYNLDIKTKDKILLALKYRDKLGINYIIYTKSIAKHNTKEMSKTIAISIYHFNEKNSKIELLRKIYDYIECGSEESFGLYILKNSLTITDIDKDGIAEVTFLYSNNCLNDMCAMNMKLIMLENSKKYVLRGAVAVTFDGKIEGQNEAYLNIGKSFDKAPKEFLKFAKKRWNKYSIWDLNN